MNFLLAVSSSFFLAFFSYPHIIRALRSIGCIDVPGGRKIHSKSIPSMGGGLIFFASVLVLILISQENFLNQYGFLMLGLSVTFLIGLVDDAISLRPRYKLLGQIIAAFIIVHFADIRLYSFYDFSGYILPDYASYILTIFVIIAITNAFNLIDGIDGLAGSLAIAILTFFGIWFYNVGLDSMAILLLSTIGGVGAFLLFNWQPAKIFMGDTGALFIGFIISISAIKFIDINHSMPIGADHKFVSSIGIALAVLIIPISDTIRVFTGRILRKKSPFIGDKTHIHHLLLKSGLSHQQSTLILLAVNYVFIFLAYSLASFSTGHLLVILIPVTIALNLILDFRRWRIRFYKLKKSLVFSSDPLERNVILNSQ